MKRKLFALVLVLVMVFGLCACQLIYHMQKHSDGMLEEQIYYSDGSIKSYRWERADGSAYEEQYGENGNYTYSYQRWADGRTEETYYYANGNPKTVEEHCPESENSIYRYMTCRENGICEEELLRFADGSTEQYKYNADGCVINRRRDYPNGDWTERTYYPSGRIKTEEGSVGGEYCITRYDENGMLIED